MEELQTEAVNDALAGFMNLACGTFAGSRFAVVAETLAKACAPLADLAETVAGDASRVEVILLRRGADDVRGLAEESCRCRGGGSHGTGGLRVGARPGHTPWDPSDVHEVGQQSGRQGREGAGFSTA